MLNQRSWVEIGVMFSVILTARSSQERGQEGPQLLNAVPGTCEHGATKNTHTLSKHCHRIDCTVNKPQYAHADHVYSEPLPHSTHSLNVPGQWSVLQAMTSVPSPSQKLPSPSGLGLSHSLLRLRTPPPHDLVHSIQLFH